MKHRIQITDRSTGEVSHLEIEAASPVAALKMVNSADFTATAGNASGEPLTPPAADKEANAQATPQDSPRGYMGLPAWVATESSMRGSTQALAFFGIPVGLIAAFFGFTFLADQARLTSGQALGVGAAFAVGFVVVSLGLIVWKLSAIAAAMKSNKSRRQDMGSR